MNHILNKILRTALILTLIGTVIAIQLKFGSESSADLGTEHYLFYVPDPHYINMVSAGFSGIIADIYWIKTVLYCGKRSSVIDFPMIRKQLTGDCLETPGFIAWKQDAKQRYSYLPDLINLIVSLEPHFQEPYIFGGLMNSMKAGEVDKSISLLESGQHYFSRSWQFSYLLGYNYYFYKDETEKAVEYFMQAGALPNCPKGVKNLAVAILYKTGRREVAIDFLTNLKENARDTETTRELDRLLQELKRPDAEIPDGKESDKDIDTKISIDLHTAGVNCVTFFRNDRNNTI